MKLKYFHFLPFFSFFKKFEPNSIIFKIIKAFFVGILLTSCIYLSYFNNIFIELISPILSILGLVLLLALKDKTSYFLSGFFTGIFWLWWLGLSSIYFNLSFLLPFIVLFIGLVYGLLFFICYFFKFDLLRLAAIFALSYIHILGFNWFDFQIFSVAGTFEAGLRGTICIFLIAYLIHEGWISLYYKSALIASLFILGAQYKEKSAEELKLKYSLISTDISQDQKFIRENIAINAYKMIEEIKRAIELKKELIILPEGAFAFVLNKNASYFKELKRLSEEIIIIAGAFKEENKSFYNSTFRFEKGKAYAYDKLKLVPFGEEIPLFRAFFKDNFLPNMQEFARAKHIAYYKLAEQEIVNAICYEATYPAFYQRAKIMIALSNNAWFNNSSQYLLQRLLIKLNTSKYASVVYHSVNGKGTGLIKPKKLLVKELYAYFKEKYEKNFG